MDDGRNSARKVLGTAAPAPVAGAETGRGNIANAIAKVALGYDERPVESVLELEELVRLRAELSWADWKAHPRFKKDRVLGDAQRRLGAGYGDVPWAPGSVAVPANDGPAVVSPLPASLEAELLADEVFLARCDDAFEAWMDALDAEGPDTDEE